MAVVKMSSFTMTVFQQDLPALLQALQSFEEVHLSHLPEEEEYQQEGVHVADTQHRHTALREQTSRLQRAIEILQPWAPAPSNWREKISNALPQVGEQQAHAVVQEHAIEKVVEEVLRRDHHIAAAEENIRQIKEKKAQLSHWEALDVPVENLKNTQNVQVRLGTMPKRWWDDFQKYIATETSGTYVERISQDGKDVYLLIVDNRTDEKLPDLLRDANFTEARVGIEGTAHAAMKSLDEERQREEQQISQERVQLKELAREELLSLQLAYELEQAKEYRLRAEDQSMQTQTLAFLQGYVPTERAKEFESSVEQILNGKIYALDIEDAKREDEKVPIQLRNAAVVEPFESIVTTYALPKYNEPDPTPLLAPWYMLFFGMMIGDVGYGVLLLLATSAMIHLFRWKPGMLQQLRFFRILSIPTILAGLAFGSCFGGLIPLPSLIDPTVSYMEMLIISMIIGFVNILFGLGILGFMRLREGKVKDAIYDVLFWYFILIGAVLFALGESLFHTAVAGQIGLILMIVGMVGVVLFSARDEKGAARYAWGVYNLYGVTSYVGDLVSYTRIAALMLSGAYIGYAGNLIANMLFGGGIAGLIGGVLVIAFFHLFNLFLSALSGYVHSMRLIYVEFFGKFYEGGGVPFQGMKPEATYVELKKESTRS